MNYQQTLEFLYEQLPMFQRTGQAAYKANLNNTLKLDRHLGHPHHRFKSIHVAGTNGKGSVSHMLASVLQSAGYKTGLYTSPHLLDFRERIRVDGEMVPEDFVASFVADHRDLIEVVQPSFFELTVAMAFDYFAGLKVDVAVIEVGLGGRLDSTNIIKPDLSIITNISFDHTALLGDNLEAIAREKGGIIKENTPVVVGRRQPETTKIFSEIAAKMKSQLIFAGNLYQVSSATSMAEGQMVNVGLLSEILTSSSFRATPEMKSGKAVQLWQEEQGGRLSGNYMLPLAGHYQQENLVTVLTSVGILRQTGYQISQEALHAGIENVVKLTGLAGRWQKIGEKPLIICDTAHNSDGIRRVVSQIKKLSYKKLRIVVGVVNDKDIDTMLSLLPSQAAYYFTKAVIPRALDDEVLMQKAARYGLRGNAFGQVKTALKAATADSSPDDLIFIGGSSFVVAEALEK